MNLMDLYERHQQEIERFKALRDKVWQQVLDDNEKLAEAFGGKERLDEEAKKRYDSRINSFNAEWSMEGGSRYNDMLDQHERQINSIKGIKPDEEKSETRPTQPESTLKEQFNNQSAQVTGESSNADNRKEKEQEALRAKVAKQQAAIKARKMQKKRSR